MKYLCAFLDSDEQTEYSNCDNTNLETLHVKDSPDLSEKLEEFRDTYYPVLELASWTIRRGGFRICIPSPGVIKLEKTVKDENGEVIDRPVIEYHNSIKASDYTYDEMQIIKEHLGKISPTFC